MSEIALQLHARIDILDAMIAAAIVEGVDQRFIARLRANRNDASRAWGAQIQRDQWIAATKVIA